MRRLAGFALVLFGTLLAQRPFREYPGIEYNTFPLPADYREKTEWAFARLMYPSAPGSRYTRWGADWREGNTAWTQDYPRADRHFSRAIRRLTRIHVRSAEQPVNLDDDPDSDPDSDPIFHVVYDLDERYQVPGQRFVYSGTTEKCQGCPARWRGIYDDKGRVMAAMTFQSDLGDSWEWADYPAYPERFSALGIRIGINYVVYAMTH